MYWLSVGESLDSAPPSKLNNYKWNTIDPFQFALLRKVLKWGTMSWVVTASKQEHLINYFQNGGAGSRSSALPSIPLSLRIIFTFWSIKNPALEFPTSSFPKLSIITAIMLFRWVICLDGCLIMPRSWVLTFSQAHQDQKFSMAMMGLLMEWLLAILVFLRKAR